MKNWRYWGYRKGYFRDFFLVDYSFEEKNEGKIKVKRVTVGWMKSIGLWTRELKEIYVKKIYWKIICNFFELIAVMGVWIINLNYLNILLLSIFFDKSNIWKLFHRVSPKQFLKFLDGIFFQLCISHFEEPEIFTILRVDIYLRNCLNPWKFYEIQSRYL